MGTRKNNHIDVTSSVHMVNDLASSTMLTYTGLDRNGFTRHNMDSSPARSLGQLSYTSDKHPKHFLESMCLLYKRHELCDVTLCVGSHRIPAHKVVLSACSPYFCAMFTGELAESKQTEITIKDVDEMALQTLIDFCYTAHVIVEESNVQTLLPAACILHLTEIQNICCEFLKQQLAPSNVLGIRAFADTHACRDLLRVADKFTQHNFTEVMESEEFLLLPVSQLIDIIASEELNVQNEEQVYVAAMAWVKHSLEDRKLHLSTVLQHVRFPQMQPKFLVGTVGTDLLIKSDESCRDLVDEAKNYLLLPQDRSSMQGPRTRPRKPIKCGEVLFAVGGWCSGDAINSVEKYDPNTNEWRMVAPMNKRRCGVGVAVLNDLLYAVGGHDGQSYLNSIERYDPQMNRWSCDVAPTSSCRTSVGVAVLDGYLYACGGQDGVSCLNYVERYDPQFNCWSKIAAMNSRRLGVGVAVLGGFLYAVGGSDGQSPLNTVERYDPRSNTWTKVSPMGTHRKHLGVAVYNNMIYAVGGRDDSSELSSAERYNPTHNTWQPVVAMTSRRSGMDDCCFCRDGDNTSLTTASSKGIKSLTEIASSRNDLAIINLVRTRTEIRYHRKCYIYYIRYNPGEDKENAPHHSKTPTRIQLAEEPVRKKTRLSPTQIEERLCIFCQKKGWKEKALHLFGGDPEVLLLKAGNSDDIMSRILMAKQCNTQVYYHVRCYLTPLKKFQNAQCKPALSSLHGSFGESESSCPTNDDYEHKTTRESALLLRKEVYGLKSPSTYEVSLDAAQASVPRLLKFFMATLFNCQSGELTSPIALSIAQDIMCGVARIRTAKHIALATNLRQLTGSKKVVSLLSDLGHCSSYIDTLRIETTSANHVLQSFRENKVFVPQNMTLGRFVFGAADNIDFGNATMDGRGTTHGVNLILYQPNSHTPTSNNAVQVVSPSASLQLSSTDLYGHIDTSHIKYPTKATKLPECAVSNPETNPCENPCIGITHQWVAERKNSSDVPTWYAYNGRLVPEQTPTTLSYLPMVNEKSTDTGTVYKCIKIMQLSMEKPAQEPIVIFMDQAMYSIGQQVIWANKNELRNVMLMMGGFHLSMNYMSSLGSMFGPLGWRDLVCDAGLFCDKVAENLLDCKPYTRCLKAHIAVYEALSYVRLDLYDEWLKSHPTDSMDDMVSQMCQISAQFKFWTQYLEAIELLLTQLYAERTGNWGLYVQTLQNMIPYFFVTDRVKYSRWLSIHVHELLSLEGAWPIVYAEFVEGNFVVNRTKNRFSSVPGDLALEQTLNKDVKCNGGLIGSTTNDNARLRWFLTSHMKANIAAELSRMCTRERNDDSKHMFPHHSDNASDQRLSVIWPGKLYTHITENQIMPFGSMARQNQIFNFVTGNQLSENDSKEVVDSLRKAEIISQDYMKNCIVSKEKSVHSTINKMKIPFQPKAKTSPPTTISKQNDAREIQRLSRLVIVASARNLPVEQYVTAESCAVPQSLCQADGTMRRTDKSQLAKCLKAELGEGDFSSISTHLDSEKSALVVDGMCAINKYRPTAPTFGEYSVQLFSKLLGIMRLNNCLQLDLLFDSYRENSIKDGERKRRGDGTKHGIIRINHAGTKIPLKWQDYLTVTENKRNLVEFLVAEAKSEKIRALLYSTEMIICGGRGETITSTGSGDTISAKLTTNHDEADTMIIYHIKAQLNVIKNFIILCDDTDVLVLLTHFVYKWGIATLKVFMLTGDKNGSKYIPVHDLVKRLDDKPKRLIGLHCITGCDSVNSLYGISKSRGYKNSNHSVLEDIGSDIKPPSHEMVCGFFYALYGQQEVQGTMNQLRYKLMAEQKKFGSSLPPTDNALSLHAKRANYQAFLWKQADTQIMKVDPPYGHGWKQTEDGPVPDYEETVDIDPIVSCGCSGACDSMRCSCKRAAVVCTDICRCQEACCNRPLHP